MSLKNWNISISLLVSFLITTDDCTWSSVAYTAFTKIKKDSIKSKNCTTGLIREDS